MNEDLISALKQIEKERSIPMEIIFEAMESALTAAYKKKLPIYQDIVVQVERKTGRVLVFALKNVVSEVANPDQEISIEEASSMLPDVREGDQVEIEITPSDVGRIAAQTAKQVIMQKIREAERDIVFGEFTGKVGDIISGVAQRYEQKNLLIDLGRAEAVMPQNEQVPTEYFRHGERLKALVMEVMKTTRGPQVKVSRTHPALVKKLFELEVPEIHHGVIEIKVLAREPGYRTKIAVASRESNVDPVGACVGPKGSRVQAIVDELRGEKIDIVHWNENPVTFLSSALSPAKVLSVSVNNADKSAMVVVPEHQLSLAIGKDGQNARLAARLTGWKVDIKSDAQIRAQEAPVQEAPVQEAPAQEAAPPEEGVKS